MKWHGLRILLVEDDPDYAELYRLRLQTDGHDVKWAPDGEMGVAAFRGWAPDLVIVDVRRPMLAGLDMLRGVRGDPLGARVPVLMLTASSDRGIRRRARALGALTWIVRPGTAPCVMAQLIARWADPAHPAETSLMLA